MGNAYFRKNRQFFSDIKFAAPRLILNSGPILFLNVPIRPLFAYFRLFYMTQIKYKLIKSLMVCLGLEPGEAERKA